MNEKIKELIKQSGIKLELDPDSNCYEAQVDDDDMEYFAELIVKECADFIKEWESYQVDMANQCNGNFPTGGNTKLKEHFGVEL